ncbi:MAG: SGNH/GDSL hydrolase family protein [Candidatus Marinimicrobia bacterium]|nr:SGNH/GDSL hydrolase family protein [Candidatus Neomarinimicrobiota bacterium]
MKHMNNWIGSKHICLLLFIFSVGLHGQTLDSTQAEKTDITPQSIWFDGRQLTLEGKGWPQTTSTYDRLPASAQGKVTDAVWALAKHSAGLSLRFTTDAEEIQVRWTLINAGLSMPHMPATGVSGVDLYERDEEGEWRFVANGRPTGLTNTVKFDVTPTAELRLYLPLYNGVSSVEIGIPPSKTLSKVYLPKTRRGAPKARPIVFYGTSITQGGCVSRPGLAVPAIIGREVHLPTINLGFSGSGKMEAEMAELLSQLDPAIFVLDCLWNMDNEMVAKRVKPFVRILRKHHPETPILLVEDASFENITPTSKGRILRGIYMELKQEGVKHVDFLSNKDMLGSDYEGTVDGVHPNDLGMMRQAQVFKIKLRSMLEPSD